MTKKQRKIILFTVVISMLYGIAPMTNAMHIMEGYLPPAYCIAWGILCIPFLAAGVFSIQKIISHKRKTLLLFAMVGAFSFVLSALKLPSVTGSSSHPTGTGLGAVLFGPAPMAVIGTIVLLFQAILLAHGGLTTLGANTFSMAVAGPFLAYGIYVLCKKMKLNKLVGIFLAAALGNLFTYLVTSFQLALAYPSEAGGVGASMVKFMSVFAFTQIPLAIIEGILTVIVVIGLESFAKPELRELGYMEGGTKK